MKVTNLNNIAAALNTVAKDGNATVVISSFTKSTLTAIAGAGDLFFSIQLDEVPGGQKASALLGRTLQITVDSGSVVLLDTAPVDKPTKVPAASKPGRSCLKRISSADVQ